MQTQSAEGQCFKTYTGTKTIKAMPMDARHAKDAGATDRFNEGMKGTMADYEIEKVAETKIMDVYPYDYSSKSSDNG